MAAWLADDRRRVVIPVVVAGALFAWLADFASYAASPGPYFGSPSSAFHQVLDGRSRRIGEIFGADDLAPATLIAILTLVAAVTLAIVAGSRRLPGRVLVPAVGLPVLLFGAIETSYVLAHMTTSSGTRGAVGRTLEDRDWIDTALPDGAAAGLIPSPEATFPVESLWWETELFNKDVDRAWAVDKGPTYTPFPSGHLSLDRDAGTFRADRAASEYLVMSEGDKRFELTGDVLGRNRSAGLVLLRPRRPYRASWATRYVDGASGSLLSKRTAVRVFGTGESRRAEVRVTLAAPPDARRGYEVVARSDRADGSITPGRSRMVRMSVCVAAGGFRDVAIRPRGRPAPAATTVAVVAVTVRRRSGCAPT